MMSTKKHFIASFVISRRRHSRLTSEVVFSLNEEGRVAVLSFTLVRRDRILMNTKSAANETIAYLAGLFDGEGSVNILKQPTKKDRINPCYFLEISIGNTHKGVLQWVLENFGGRLTHNAEQHTKRNHPTWRWRASSNEACALLTMMLPYLVVKREQALLAVEFQRHVNTHPRRGNQLLSEEELAWREAQRVKLAGMRFWKEEREDR